MDLAELDDETLLEWIQKGRHDAFSVLVRRHTTRFYRIAYRMLFNKENAEDVVQDAFLKLWERPQMWNRNHKTKFTTWFYKIVTNLCIDLNRKKETAPLPEDLHVADPGNELDISLERTQEQEMLDAFIHQLPERQQLALNLCFYEGLSNKEAAKILGVRVKALQSLIMRAKAALKDKVIKSAQGGSYVNERA